MHNFECTGQFCGWQKLKESALTLRIFRENNLQLRPKRTPATSPRFICGQGRRSFYCESSLHCGAHPLQPEGVTFDNPVTAKPLRSMASRHNWCKEESCFPNTEKSLHQNRCILNTRGPQEESPGFHPDAWQQQNQPRSRRESHIAEHNDRKQFKGRCIRPSGNGKKNKSATPTIREQ